MIRKKLRSGLLWFAAAAMILPLLWASELVAQTPRTTNYTYDELGRLTFVTDTVNGNRDYDYDAAGNRRNVAVATANDAASEPGALLTPPKPTGLTKNNPSMNPCSWTSSWTASAGAVNYRFSDTLGPPVYVTATNKTVTCPTNSPATNKPVWVQACNANGCSQQSLFTP